ncbi:NAD(P)/FAD-dependent oxidoreductase [uncultured Phycicoccus sp.]|uniref:NAD(P)/FAD-dependent oxidoreductase n=1 Tax=uncultured Phycicoccus sp. TaxID=661422 RepID=UPI00345BDA97
MDADVIVIGAGLAGLRCADRLAEAGRAVLLLEREPVVGGRQRTDEVDGFLLDRGFQVLNPAYPAIRRWVDADDLALRPFGAGLLVRRDRGLVELAHPLRDPRRVPATLRSGLLTPASVTALARWAAPVLVTPRRVVTGPDRTVREGLDAAGVAGPLREEVLEPFLAGVVAEDRGETSEAFVRLLVRMFALGVPGLPARGIQALPEWLADRSRRRRGGPDLRLSTGVVGLRPGREPAVECLDGTTHTARAVVVAVGPEAVAGLVDVPAPVTRGLRTWWFAADEAPTRSDRVVVDGRRRGPMVNAAVVSNAVPSYAPAGSHLVEVTTLLGGGVDPTEDEVRRQAGEVFGTSTLGWRTIRRDDIHDALPAQPAPLRVAAPARVAEGVYVAGDHRDTASIQGALVSGHRVAGAVLLDLTAG